MSEAIRMGSWVERPPQKPDTPGIAESKQKQPIPTKKVSSPTSPLVGALGLLLLVGLLIIGIGMILDSFPATIIGLVFVLPSFLYLSYRVVKD